MFMIILTLLSALALSVVGAYMSVTGLAVLFSGISVIIIIAASAAELGKVVGVSLLYQTWEVSSKLMKASLISVIAVAMLVTSIGVSGLLSRGVLDINDNIQQSQLELTIVNDELSTVKDNISFIDDSVANYRQELKTLQEQIDAYPKNWATRKIEVYDAQKPRRDEIDASIIQLRKDKAGEIASIKTINSRRGEVKAEHIEISADIGPLKHVAKSIGISEDHAVTILMVLLIIIFDPFAVILLFGTNILIAKRFGNKNAGVMDLFSKENPPTPKEIDEVPEAVAVKLAKYKKRPENPEDIQIVTTPKAMLDSSHNASHVQPEPRATRDIQPNLSSHNTSQNALTEGKELHGRKPETNVKPIAPPPPPKPASPNNNIIPQSEKVHSFSDEPDINQSTEMDEYVSGMMQKSGSINIDKD